MKRTYEPVEPNSALERVIKLRDEVAQYDAALKRAIEAYDAARQGLLAEMLADGVSTDYRERGNRRFEIATKNTGDRIKAPNPDRLPLEYVLAKPVANLDAIKGAYKRGERIEGVVIEPGVMTVAIREVP